MMQLLRINGITEDKMFVINNNNNPSCNLCNSKLAEIFQENELTSEWTKVHFLVGITEIRFYHLYNHNRLGKT